MERKEIAFKIPYFDGFLRFRGKVIKDNGKHLLVEYINVLLDGSMNILQTSITSDMLIN